MQCFTILPLWRRKDDRMIASSLGKLLWTRAHGRLCTKSGLPLLEFPCKRLSCQVSSSEPNTCCCCCCCCCYCWNRRSHSSTSPMMCCSWNDGLEARYRFFYHRIVSKMQRTLHALTSLTVLRRQPTGWNALTRTKACKQRLKSSSLGAQHSVQGPEYLQ